jgi:hypothetical protein
MYNDVYAFAFLPGFCFGCFNLKGVSSFSVVSYIRKWHRHIVVSSEAHPTWGTGTSTDAQGSRRKALGAHDFCLTRVYTRVLDVKLP